MSTKIKRGRGRPPKPKSKQLIKRIFVNMTAAELRTLKAEARKVGMSVQRFLMRQWRKEG